MRMPALTAATAALLLVGAASASAQPPWAEPIELHCDDGQHYEVWVNGSGTFTPGNVAGSTQMLVPVWFGDNVSTITPPGGSPVIETGPDEAKGKGMVMDRVRRDLLYCTYSDSFTLTEPEMGYPAGTVVTFEGAVRGFLTGR
ncbi:hypothetical protein [Ornithinimicrobium cerasi]|uniref:Uncharacterized protein n=1 Tax=Ornithinimicrobium cerasi TaxID=2248773 RepID=A0A285VCP6_9MICO|nr:hypothetical protein [Ornithinimicrobium cerasi]SOC51830.1 hypothetical protein SAMN05421879_101324 [Ornithinimicrobium cerasi]